MIQTLSLLGSTGSIGTQALDIIRRLGIQVKALAAYRNIERLEQQIREFQPEFAAVYDVALDWRRYGRPAGSGGSAGF